MVDLITPDLDDIPEDDDAESNKAGGTHQVSEEDVNAAETEEPSDGS